MHQVLINGKWQDSQSTSSFAASDPAAAKTLEEQFPVSSWADIDAALAAANTAFQTMAQMEVEQLAKFLEAYADALDAQSDAIRKACHLETALPLDTRLVGELARTTNQLRLAAQSTRKYEWQRPVIDTKASVRSCYGPLGPVAVFGPNNFPLAYGGISGGDFAAAIAAGNPVIAKANPMHPHTTKLLAEIAQEAADATGMPPGTVQLLYHMDYADGEKMIRDSRLSAVGFTGSRKGGLALKKVADEVGTPIYLELSSVNPVVILPNAMAQNSESIAKELTASCALGAGQFCTNPGLVIIHAADNVDDFVQKTAELMAESPIGTLFSESGQTNLNASIQALQSCGATLVVGGKTGGGTGYSHANTVLRVSGADFLKEPVGLQQEAFGPSTLIVVSESVEQTVEIVDLLEGNLTGCFYSAEDGSDDRDYDVIEPHLRRKVGRLINDKMPTGVAVSPAMNHGGPFPATGHPGFTAVGAPGAITRFSMLQCYDNVRPHRLPKVLQNPSLGEVWRMIDGELTQRSV